MKELGVDYVTALSGLRWGKVFRAAPLKEFLPHTLSGVSRLEDESFLRPYFAQIRSLYILKKHLYFNRCRKGSISNSRNRLQSDLEDCKKVISYFFSNKEPFGFSDETLDSFYFNYTMGVLGDAVMAKEKSVVSLIMQDEKFAALLKEGTSIKARLLKHKTYALYRLVKRMKDKLSHMEAAED